MRRMAAGGRLRNFLRRCLPLPVLFIAVGMPAAADAFEVQEVVSPGGVGAWLVEDHSIPLIAIAFGFHGGSALDPAGKEGVARFVSGLLDEGAGDLDSQAFQRRINDLAIDYQFEAGVDEFTGSMRMLTERRDEGFELLRLALTEPRFDAEPVERIRGQLLAILADESGDPSSIADRVWWHATYGDHAYARATAGTKAGIAAIAADDMRGFVRRIFARDNVVIGVVGDITADELRRQLDRVFGGLPAKAEVGAIAERKLEKSAGTLIVERDMPQSVVLFGHGGVKRNDPDFFAAYLMNHILGGGSFSSRLTNEVREKRGLAYSIGTGLVTLDRTGIVMGSVGTQNARVAETLAIIRAEWGRMRDDGPTEQELADAKLYLTGSYALRFSNTTGIADIMVGVQLEGFAKDYFEKRNDYVNAVTLADVRRVAKRLLDPDALTVVIVGQPEGVAATAPGPTPEGLF